MAIEDLLTLVQKDFEKKFGKGDKLKLDYGNEVPPATGLIVDNPLMEYILDRRFLAYGRCYLIYGKKGNAKTSLFFNLAKMFQKAGGDVVWIETEKAADLDYAAKQGVDLKRLIVPECDTLQEALTVAEGFIKNLPKAYKDGDTPVLICLDSIAGAIPEYELGNDVTVGEVKVGEHARLMSGFYRRIIHPLSYEKAIFVALNQLKVAIGKMSFGGEEAEALIGGDAQRFHSTYQFKLARTGDMVLQKFKDGPKRKIGSRHEIVCKRNKLGREGNSQKINFDLYIDGGIDWYTPLVVKLKDEYPELVSDKGAYVVWEPLNCMYDSGDGNMLPIPNDNVRTSELAKMIEASHDAKELIRKAFEIPDLPPEEVVKEIEIENKKKRSRKKVDDDNPEGPTIEL